MSSAPIVNVLLDRWWGCLFLSVLISQLWSLLSTIRQTRKEAFSCSSALEIFLQTEKGSRECHLSFTLFWAMVTMVEGSLVPTDRSVQYRIAKLATDSQLGQSAPRLWEGFIFLPFLLGPKATCVATAQGQKAELLFTIVIPNKSIILTHTIQLCKWLRKFVHYIIL